MRDEEEGKTDEEERTWRVLGKRGNIIGYERDGGLE